MTSVYPVFSHEIFATQELGGVSRYIVELRRALHRLGVPSTLMAPLHRNDLLRGYDRALGMRIPERLRVKGSSRVASEIGGLIEPMALAFLGKRHSDMVLHKSYYSATCPSPRVPTAITVHDMTHELYSDVFSPGNQTSAWKRMWCHHADVVIAVSHHTKRQLLRYVDIAPERVAVCHHGVVRVEPDAPTSERLSGRRPFLLYVGQRRGYKSFDRLIEAYARTSAATEGICLVAFGGGPPGRAELRMVDEHGLSSMVSFTGGGDAVLAAHYATAVALVYPSLDEGFGFPPLEAMQYGCPVAAARAGAIPEVVDQAALLFDPRDLHAMTASIDQIVGDAELRSRLSQEGIGRAGRFSWEKTADATLAAYADALRRAQERS